PGGYTPSYPSLEVIVNGGTYDDKGILLEGNAYVPIDLVDQLGIDLSQHPDLRRVSYRNVVFVRAIDLKDFHLSVTMGGNQAVMVRSMLPISATQLEQIMGQGQTSEVQMMMFLKSHHPEGLSRFPDLPKLYREEATIEGVNYDIAFAQMCVETNFLRFGTTVSPEQNNFASLGAIGSGAEGATFSDSRLGVRAQIQHLKAYASTEPLVQAIIDPRFPYIRRGVAPGIRQLSGRWSADATYHQKILAVLKRLYEAAGFF
ncbi:MAG TPA: glucosaminidase domain-containing protein, partial [Allocoleopsis sp.]